jgi:hypothetical protein
MFTDPAKQASEMTKITQPVLTVNFLPYLSAIKEFRTHPNTPPT